MYRRCYPTRGLVYGADAAVPEHNATNLLAVIA
jgi:hypothetical protein